VAFGGETSCISSGSDLQDHTERNESLRFYSGKLELGNFFSILNGNPVIWLWKRASFISITNTFSILAIYLEIALLFIQHYIEILEMVHYKLDILTPGCRKGPPDIEPRFSILVHLQKGAVTLTFLIL
jgi:hypothetical protein